MNRRADFIVFASILLLAVLSVHIYRSEPPTIPEVDRIRIAEGFRIVKEVGNEIWENWDKAPFSILLVTPEYEFLVRHPDPSYDFKYSGYDSLLQSKFYFRKRIYEKNLLATFPAVSGISTVVIGQVENTTPNTSTRWVVVLLHEHFHQLQNSQPDYYSEVAALDLAKEDKTGMWMLNYPFPYDSERVVTQFSILAKSLAEALQAMDKNQFSQKLAKFYRERTNFRKILNPDDYKYFSFQLWQEGVARYTEYCIAKLAGQKYEPSPEFKALKDFSPFQKVAESIHKDIVSKLPYLRINELKRRAFYYFGSAEAMLLDRINPDWKQHYFKEKFYLEKYAKLDRIK